MEVKLFGEGTEFGGDDDGQGVGEHVGDLGGDAMLAGGDPEGAVVGGDGVGAGEEGPFDGDDGRVKVGAACLTPLRGRGPHCGPPLRC